MFHLSLGSSGSLHRATLQPLVLPGLHPRQPGTKQRVLSHVSGKLSVGGYHPSGDRESSRPPHLVQHWRQMRIPRTWMSMDRIARGLRLPSILLSTSSNPGGRGKRGAFGNCAAAKRKGGFVLPSRMAPGQKRSFERSIDRLRNGHGRSAIEDESRGTS